jgi:FkbM family methyltransferase
MSFDKSSAHGKYAPTGNKKHVIQYARSMPINWFGRKMVSVLRSAAGLRDFGPYDVEVFGQKFRLYPSTNRGDKNALTAPQFFDPQERAALAEFFANNSDAALIDLGANIGVYSAYARQIGFQNIIAIEADPEMFARMSFNLPNSVTKLNIAIAEEEGVLPFYINEKNRGENSLVNKTGREVTVRARALLAVVQENLAGRKYALKIDVEGMEQKIFQQLFATAKASELPSLVIVEHLYSPEATALLEQNGYVATLRTKLNSVYVR